PRGRDAEANLRPLAELGVEVDGAAERPDDLPGDRETEARAATRRAPASREALERALPVGRRDPGAGVFDLELRDAAEVAPVQHDRAALRVARGVGPPVPHGLPRQ